MANPLVLTDWTLILNEGTASATATLPVFADGSNRLALVAFCAYNGAGTASVPTSVSANGRTASLVVSPGVDQTRIAVGLYAFLESDVAAISGQTLNSAGGTGTQKSVLVLLLQNAKQEIPTVATIAYAATSSTLTIPLSRLAESISIAIGFTSQASTSLPFTNPARTATANLTSGRRVSWGAQNDTANTSDFVVTGSAYTNALIVNLSIPSSHAITDVNGGAALKPGVPATLATTGFSPDVNQATFDGVACTAASANAFTPAALVDGQPVARPGNRTLVVGNGTQSANTSVLAGVPDLHSFQTLAGTLNTGLYSWLPAEAEVGDFVIFQTEIDGVPTGTEIDPDGTGRTNHEGEQTLWLVKGDSGMAGRYLVITGPGGEVISISRYLESAKLKSEFLTSRFLESSFI